MVFRILLVLDVESFSRTRTRDEDEHSTDAKSP
jgi:hypothetical protein